MTVAPALVGVAVSVDVDVPMAVSAAVAVDVSVIESGGVAVAVEVSTAVGVDVVETVPTAVGVDVAPGVSVPTAVGEIETFHPGGICGWITIPIASGVPLPAFAGAITVTKEPTTSEFSRPGGKIFKDDESWY